MPFIDVTHMSGVLAPDRVDALSNALVEAGVAVEGEGMRVGIGVAVREAAPGAQKGAAVFARLTLIRDALTAGQREQAIIGVTEAIVDAVGEQLRPGVWVVVEESVSNGEWGIGGRPLTFEVMDRLRAGAEHIP